MKTDDLVAFLAKGTEPVERHAVGRRYAIGLGLGVLAASLLMLSLLGLRPDLDQAVLLPMFWAKLGFVACLAAASLLAALRLSQPGRYLDWVPAGLVAPVLVMWTLGAVALAGAGPTERLALIFGTTWKSCPWLIVMLSLPVFAAAFWAMRGLAPTRLALAGTAAGLLAGTIGALVYCLHCPELDAPFVGSWYLLGILVPALIGSAIGPRLLRW
jgi:hypothetical protein